MNLKYSWAALSLVVVGSLLPAIAPPALASTPPSTAVDPTSLAGLPSDGVAGSSVAAGTSGSGGTTTAELPAAAPLPTWTPTSGSAHRVDLSHATPSTRTATTNDYVDADGTHTLQVSQDSINYQAADGSWAAIDNSVVADPALPGGFMNKANSWHVHFGSTAAGVTVEVPGGQAMTMIPASAAIVAPVVRSDGSVLYADVWPHADLVYRVTGDTVEESVMLKTRAASASYGFTVATGTSTSMLGTPTTTNAATRSSSTAAGTGTQTPARVATGTRPTMTKQSDGSLTPSGDLQDDLTLLPPVVVGHDGAPVDGAKATLTSSAAGQVKTAVDSAWLAAQPDSAFPINLDPTVQPGMDSSTAFKSDGYTCNNCGIQVGSINSGGAVWRSQAHFNYEQLYGTQVIDSYVALGPLASGTSDNFTMVATDARGSSFQGAVAGGPLASGTTDSGVLDDAGLTQWINARVQAQLGGGALGFYSNETPNIFSYQKWNSPQLVITYDHLPTTPQLRAPGSGTSIHATTVTLDAISTDSDGDALHYAFSYGTDPAHATRTTQAPYNSGDLTTNTFALSADGLWGQTVYRSASVHDPYTDWVDTTAVASITLPDAPPPAPTTTTPGDGAVVATTAPTLSVPAVTDPDGDQVLYNFTISGGADTPTGRASSGWQTATSWSVPAGVLVDGQSYTWSVATGDGPVPGQPHPGPWKSTAAVIAPHLTVNLRLGTSGPTPSDNLGGASVNLANGNVTVAVAGHTVSSVGGALGVGMTYNSQAGVRTGLLGQYYADPDRKWDFATAGLPALVRVDPSLDIRWNQPGYPAAPPRAALRATTCPLDRVRHPAGRHNRGRLQLRRRHGRRCPHLAGRQVVVHLDHR